MPAKSRGYRGNFVWLPPLNLGKFLNLDDPILMALLTEPLPLTAYCLLQTASGRDELPLVRWDKDRVIGTENPRNGRAGRRRFAMARPRCKAFRSSRACRDVGHSASSVESLGVVGCSSLPALGKRRSKHGVATL